MTLLAIREGMLVDNLLKLDKRNADYATMAPTAEGKNCVYHYVDCEVVLSYWDNAWRVKDVRIKQ
jgi:hypothetical protein